MARPIEFNRQDVVEKAVILFRKKGFNGTSMRDIEAATGLNPGSFYSSFGNKQKFFLETLVYFYQGVQVNLRNLLGQEDNPIIGIRKFFDVIIGCVCHEDDSQRCCYVIKSALELSAVDAQVKKIVQDHFEKMESLLRDGLASAKDKGYLPDHVPVENTAKILLNNLYGINVDGMINPNQQKLLTMTDTLFDILIPSASV